MDSLIITLDGPAGSGKSTVARQLARRLNLEFLDTGAMYRGITAACLDASIHPAAQPHQTLFLLSQLAMRFDWQTDPPRLHITLDGVDRDVTSRLRDADVTTHVSDIAAMSQVRRYLVSLQQTIGREHPRLVTEGRDQGSVVFPDAQMKFYLQAHPKVRAQRRAMEIRQAGKPVDEEQIYQQIVERDHRDASRADGPLICPPDALRIDTSDMNLTQVVDTLERCVRQRCSSALESSSSNSSPH